MKLKVRDLHFDINNDHILNGINIDFTDQILTLIGPSGSGKSTLLRLLVALEKPLSGTIEINGELISSTQNLIDFRKKIGVIFQHFFQFLIN